MPLFLVTLLARVGSVGIVSGALGVAGGALSFFSTPLGRFVGVALLCVGAFLWGDVHRYRIEREHCQEQIADLVKAARDREAAIREFERKEAERRIAELAKERDEAKKRLADYERDIAKNPRPTCRLD